MMLIERCELQCCNDDDDDDDDDDNVAVSRLMEVAM